MTNYLDKDGLKKFWDITKGKYSPIGHTHDDRYLSNVNTSISGQTVKINDATLTVPTKLSELTDDVVSGKYLQWTQNEARYSLSVSTKDTDKDPITVDTGGGILVDGNTGTPFKLWLHDTSNVWYKQTKGGAWAKMDAGKADMLSTARTIWGQSFDGSGNVDGAMTVNGTIHATGAATLDSTLAVNGIATFQKNITTASDRMVFDVGGKTGNGNETGFNFNGLVYTSGNFKGKGLFILDGSTPIMAALAAQGVRLYKDTTLSNTLKVVGNVGIGTDADSAYKLKVNGKAYVSDDATVNGILTVNDVIRNGDFYTDGDGWVYTPHIVIGEYDGLVISDANGIKYTFDVEKAKELGLLS